MSKEIKRIGFYSALVAFIATVGYDIVQSLQVVGVLKFPVDSISIYAFSLFIPVPFLLAMLSLHYSTNEDKNSGAMPLCFFR